MKKITYGIAFIGLIVSGCIYLRLAAKDIFVRILRNSQHLQSNTFAHWATWLAAVWGLAALGLYSQKVFRFLVGWAPFLELCASPLFSLFFLRTVGSMAMENIEREPWARMFFTGSIGYSLHLVCLCALVGFMPLRPDSYCMRHKHRLW
jgi:hypothetical protein